MATHIKSIIQNFLKDTKGEAGDRARMQEIVGKNLDKKLKGHVCLARVYKNKLIFNSESSNFSYVFNLKKEGLLKEIQKEFPQIEDIRISIG